MTTINQMADAIRSTTGAVEMIAGGHDSVESTAAEWCDAGFSPAVAREWWNAGAFTADDAAAMRDAGLTPSQVAADHPTHEGMSWGYAVCNGDASVAKAVSALAE